MSSLTFYPPSPKEALAQAFVGKSLREVPTPAAVLNVAAARRNCGRMLEAVGGLGLGWRAHVKTHKVIFSFFLACSSFTARGTFGVLCVSSL